jgi:hypothetical protein
MKSITIQKAVYNFQTKQQSGKQLLMALSWQQKISAQPDGTYASKIQTQTL